MNTQGELNCRTILWMGMAAQGVRPRLERAPQPKIMVAGRLERTLTQPP
jgi:hypothetical protein